MTTNDPNPKERFDYLAPWEEDWYDESNPLMPYEQERSDSLPTWQEGYWFGSTETYREMEAIYRAMKACMDSNLLDGEMDLDASLLPEPEFVLDTPQYWENYRDAVMNLANQILSGARPAKDEPK